MVRIIAGVLVGAIALVVISLSTGGATVAAFHLEGLNHADSDHPHAALNIAVKAMFAAGTLLGAFVGTYASIRIGRWPKAVGLVAAIGAIDAYSAAGMFADMSTMFALSTITMIAGCWLGYKVATGSASGKPARDL